MYRRFSRSCLHCDRFGWLVANKRERERNWCVRVRTGRLGQRSTRIGMYIMGRRWIVSVALLLPCLTLTLVTYEVWGRCHCLPHSRKLRCGPKADRLDMRAGLKSCSRETLNVTAGLDMQWLISNSNRCPPARLIQRKWPTLRVRCSRRQALLICTMWSVCFSLSSIRVDSDDRTINQSLNIHRYSDRDGASTGTSTQSTSTTDTTTTTTVAERSVTIVTTTATTTVAVETSRTKHTPTVQRSLRDRVRVESPRSFLSRRRVTFRTAYPLSGRSLDRTAAVVPLRSGRPPPRSEVARTTVLQYTYVQDRWNDKGRRDAERDHN